MADLLAASPDARLICIVDLNSPYWLTRKRAYDSFDAISHAASDPEWRRITTEWMRDFLAYSEQTYGDTIDAYILSGGGTSEWYEYDRGKSSRVKNTAWQEWCEKEGLGVGADMPGEAALRTAAHDDFIYDPKTESHKIAYWRFHNEVIAETVCQFAESARAQLGAGKEIGVFFGYYFVSDAKLVSFGHLDYERVFASPHIDFVISPGSYNDRQIGGGSGSQLVLGTAQRHGKRYLHEIDHRTHAVTTAGTDEWQSQADDTAGLKREAAFALVHHASRWLFDMWGGWYQEDTTRELIGQLQSVHEAYADDTSPSVAEVLLVADPQSAYYVNDKDPRAAAMARKFREATSRTGAPFDVYSFNDLPSIDLSPYKVVLLPATLLITPQRAAVLSDHVLCGGRTVVWAYAPGMCDGYDLDVNRVKTWTGSAYGVVGPATVEMDGWTSVYAHSYETLSPAALRQILDAAGVHRYVDGDTPVYANEKLIAIHCKTGGSKTVTLRRPSKRVIDLHRDTVVAEDCVSFTYQFETPDTALFALQG